MIWRLWRREIQGKWRVGQGMWIIGTFWTEGVSRRNCSCKQIICLFDATFQICNLCPKAENELFSKHRKDYTWFYIMINDIKNNCLDIIFWGVGVTPLAATSRICFTPITYIYHTVCPRILDQFSIVIYHKNGLRLGHGGHTVHHDTVHFVTANPPSVWK